MGCMLYPYFFQGTCCDGGSDSDHRQRRKVGRIPREGQWSDLQIRQRQPPPPQPPPGTPRLLLARGLPEHCTGQPQNQPQQEVSPLQPSSCATRPGKDSYRSWYSCPYKLRGASGYCWLSNLCWSPVVEDNSVNHSGLSGKAELAYEGGDILKWIPSVTCQPFVAN